MAQPYWPLKIMEFFLGGGGAYFKKKKKKGYKKDKGFDQVSELTLWWKNLPQCGSSSENHHI